MVQSERVRRVTRNTLYNASRSVIGTALAFLIGIVIARGLGPEGAGAYTLVIWVGIAVGLIVSEGLDLTLTKAVAQRAGDPRATASIVTFGIRAQLAIAVCGALVLAAASGLLASAFDIPNGQHLFVLAAVLVLLFALIENFTVPIVALERQGLLVPLKTAWSVVWLGAVVLTILVYDAGLVALVTVQVFVWIAAGLLHFGVMSRVVNLRRATRLSSRRKREIARSTFALTATSTVGLIVFNRSEVFILGIFATSADVAYYSIGYAMADALQVIVPTALAFAVIPTMSRSFADQDLALARRAYEGQLRWTALAAGPVAVSGAVLSGTAISVFYGPDFEAATLPLAVLLFSAGACRMGFCARWVLISSDRERLVFALTAGAAVLCLGLGLALIPPFGVAGATAAEATTQIVLMTTSIVLVARTVGFPFPMGGILRIVVANIPVLVVVSCVQLAIESGVLTLLVGLLMTFPAYAVGLWASKALTPYEKQYLRTLVPMFAKH